MQELLAEAVSLLCAIIALSNIPPVLFTIGCAAVAVWMLLEIWQAVEECQGSVAFPG